MTSHSQGQQNRPPGLWSLAFRTNLPLGLMALFVGTFGLFVITSSGNTVKGDPTIGVVITVVIAGFGAWFTWRAVAQLRNWLGVLRSPVRVEAMVIEIKDTGTRVNREPRYAVHYQYRDEAGVIHSGASHHLKPEESDLWRNLDVAEVHYNRHRPECSLLVGQLPLRRSSRDERSAAGVLRPTPRWTKAAASPEQGPTDALRSA